MRRHLTTPAVGRLNHDTGLGRKRANRAAHERSSTGGSNQSLEQSLVCLDARPPKSPNRPGLDASCAHGIDRDRDSWNTITVVIPASWSLRAAL